VDDETAAPPEPTRWLTLRPLKIGAAALLLTLLVVAGIKSYRDLVAVRQQESALRQDVARTEQRIDDLRHRVERLRSDPATLERLAREELGMVHPGDVVIVLPPEEEAPAAAAPATPAPAPGASPLTPGE
jgi:cell division protein FtsB